MNKIIKDILEKLENAGYQAYIVGGFTRDYLLNKESNDYDICTSAPIKEVFKIISGKVNIGSSLNVKIKDLNIDITTFRVEKNYVNHYPEITYTSDLNLDLQRRDFTINTICMDKNEHIIDELGGINDLKNKIIRIVGNTFEKIKEDPLRILRAIRFATVLDFTLDNDLINVIKNNASLVATLSTYRIKEELDKILVSKNYQKGLSLLKEFNLLTYLGITYQNVIYTNDLCGMWSQIEVNKELPFTKSEKNNIVRIKEIVNNKIINNHTLYNYGLYLTLVAGDILKISRIKIKKLYQQMPLYCKNDLAISFKEIKDLLNEEPIIVRKMENLIIRKILDNHLINDKESIKKFILENKAIIHE